MLRFSSSYAYGRSNFVILGCNEERCADETLYSLLCVAQNIIQRGTPTVPSPLLQERLGAPPKKVDGSIRITTDKGDHAWIGTIKGSSETGFNPALMLYETILPEALPEEKRCILDRILPEALISDIVADEPVEFVDQRVDFYCDRAKLVIEVDGSQHCDPAQRNLDDQRDGYLDSKGITTLRIPASDIKNRTQALYDAMARLVDRLERAPALVSWEQACRSDEAASIARYELAIRMQVALVEALKRGMIDLRSQEVRMRVLSDVLQQEGDAIFRAAYDDVFEILSNLYRLLGEELAVPTLVIDEDDALLALDVSIGSTWTESEAAWPHAGMLLVRNDYFEDHERFEVTIAEPIEYRTTDLRNEPLVEEALRFFLRLLYGYDDFNDGQMGIIKKALARHPTLGILPTGSGKSACYQMACLLQPCISFVVCPIVSLIQDQKANLDEFCITHTACIYGDMNPKKKHRILSDFGRGRYLLIWISPERFQTQGFRNQLSSISQDRAFGYAVLDEVHCLSEWGHDFRVSYLKLPSTIRDFCPGAVLLGLTATASRNVFEDLKAELQVTRNNVQTVGQLDRPELHYHIQRTTNQRRLEDLWHILEEVNGKFAPMPGRKTIFDPAGEDSICGIVFANTKARSAKYSTGGCDYIKGRLHLRHGIVSDTYHSGRGRERARIQERYLRNEFTLMVATKSFGMGVNKKNVRYTIHAGLPWSIESFYQEAGRAGRDRRDNESDCYVLYVPDADEERTAKLFSRQTTIDEIHALQPRITGDLSTLFYLWMMNNDTPDKEARDILTVLDSLREADAAGRSPVLQGGTLLPEKDENDRLSKTEKALYKLALLGVVRDWIVDYDKEALEVDMRDVPDEDSESFAKRKLEAYISRHGSSFSFDEPREEHARYVRAYHEALPHEKLAALIRVLIDWTNDHIIWSRRAAIGNMLSLCESGRSEEELREYINGFFKLDTPDNDILDQVVHEDADFPTWESILFETIKADDLFERRMRLRSASDLRDVAAMCDQYKESYHNSLGLEWVSLMSSLLSEPNREDAFADQLRFIERQAEELLPGGYGPLHARTLSVLEHASALARDAFGRAVVKACPDRAMETYKRLGDYATLEHIVSHAAMRLWDKWEG